MNCCLAKINLTWKYTQSRAVSLNSFMSKKYHPLIDTSWTFCWDQIVNVTIVMCWVVCFSNSDSEVHDKPHSKYSKQIVVQFLLVIAGKNTHPMMLWRKIMFCSWNLLYSAVLLLVSIEIRVSFINACNYFWFQSCIVLSKKKDGNFCTLNNYL